MKKEGTSTGTKLSASIGVVAAMVLAVLLNVFVARHYKRWDVTRGGLFTLSDATIQTLRALEEPIHVYVLLPSGDSLTLSLRHLLDGYRAETTRLDVAFVDPDRRPAEFIAVQQRYGVVAGRTEDGKILTDAAVIVVRGEKPQFITLRDLVEVVEEDESKQRPRLEQALTSAIRSLVRQERPKACFTTGHGEGAIELGVGMEAGGLSGFRNSLIKNNFDLEDIGAAKASDPGALDGCDVLVIAGPSEKVPAADVARYKAYAERGGNVFLAMGPRLDGAGERPMDRGLGELLALFGVSYGNDFVFELDPNRRLSQGFGEAFVPELRPHPITEGMLKAERRGLNVVLTVASSLSATGQGAAAVSPLLVTSDEAFGMVDFATWAKTTPQPVPVSNDRKGPLTVAFASELPKPEGSSEPHGARLVVVSSDSVLVGENWQNDEFRGTALFVNNSISWLSARPVFLDIPNKPATTAGLRVSDAWLSSMFRYVVFYIPLATTLLGVAVYLRRRSRPRAKA